MAASRLYRADTGAQIATIAVGDGLRGKAFLDEVSQLLMEGAVSPGLGATGPLQGYGREANFPTFLNGEGLATWPIGAAAPVIPAYIGTSVFKAVHNTWAFATAGVTTYGSVAPTAPTRGSANYGGAGAGDAYVVTPAGATCAARATTNAAANFNVGAGAGVATMQVIVNGVTYTINITSANRAALTLDEFLNGFNESIGSMGGAHAILTDATTAIRILTVDEGFWNTLQVVAGATANVIFAGSGALGATVRGGGGPLNDVARQPQGAKPQRRILPQSVIFTAAVGGNAITSTDNGLGVIAGNNGLGQTAAGTINYATGVVSIVYSGVTTTAPTVTYKALVPLDLTQPVRIPRTGLDLALLLN